MVTTGPVAEVSCPLTGSGVCFPEGCSRDPSCAEFTRRAQPSGLVMADVELSQGQVQEMQDRIRAAGGWCAPSEVIYMKDVPEVSPTGFIPDLNDVMTLGEERHEIFARWDEEDAWLREQGRLATQELALEKDPLMVEIVNRMRETVALDEK